MSTCVSWRESLCKHGDDRYDRNMTTKTGDKFLDRGFEHWGEWERFDERAEDVDPRMAAHGVTGNGTGEREEIYMLKATSSPKVRFYARGRGQIGAEHSHVMAATCWAYANGYLPSYDPSDPKAIFLHLACREEVLSGGVASGANGSAA